MAPDKNLTPEQELELRTITHYGQLCCVGAGMFNGLLLAWNVTSPVWWTITGICWLAETDVYKFLRNMRNTAIVDNNSGKPASFIRQELSRDTYLIGHVLELFPDDKFSQ